MNQNGRDVRTDYPVLDLIKKRWSPVAFSDKLLSDEDLRSLFEAARWAPSCFNEQPSRYIVATRDRAEEFERMLSCLVEANQAWAKYASVVMLGVVSSKFAMNGKPNRHAMHDLGLASANLSLEATSRGLHVHQMAGILPEKARQVYGIPEGHEVVTAIAIGYAKISDSTPKDFRERDQLPRQRRPSSEFVFGPKWGEAHEVL